MSAILDKIRNVFAAVGFAEAGEHQTALQMIGETAAPGAISNLLAAITFAEANCHDTAQEFMNVTPGLRRIKFASRPRVTLDDFAEAVGLSGINFKFGVVQAQ